jgi:hypothetical protein
MALGTCSPSSTRKNVMPSQIDQEAVVDSMFLSHLQERRDVESRPLPLASALRGMRLALPMMPAADLRASAARLVKRALLEKPGNSLFILTAAGLAADPYDLICPPQ